jgi:hypothetical protein
LVKDGATAIEALGDAIDASLVDLEGGTTGQILAKASNTDMDFAWITNDVGDITAVTAGTGISGGGTTGAVTITNSMATEIAAKGDLIAGTGSQTFDNVTVGTNGTSLVADSAASTGLKWGFPTSLGCFVSKTASQSIASATQVVISFDTEAYDTSGFHDNVTNNSRITIPAGLGGKYLVNTQWAFDQNATGQRVGYIRTNGSGITNLQVEQGGAVGQQNVGYSIVLSLNAGDYIELQAYQDCGAALNVLGTAGFYTFFQITYLGV